METKLDLDWIKTPCGSISFDSESSENTSGGSTSKQYYISSSETRDSISKIWRSSEIALTRAKNVKSAFTEWIHQSHEEMSNFGPIVWLKDAKTNVQKLKDSASEAEKLKLTYEVLQQYAHGIEYIIEDQIAGENKKFVAIFKEVRDTLKMVLCETRWVMNDLAIVPRETPSPVTHIAVNRNGTDRLMDDWIIYSDYIADLSIIVKELKKLSSSSEKMI